MPKSILIVEDELAIADNIAYALRTEGFASHHLSLGESALAMLQARTIAPAPDLVVLDVGLPDINGFAVLSTIMIATRKIDWYQLGKPATTGA
jgi:two-component system catabolic regulation response regulator CreB